uniref:Reverse transcriptase n=1 Tax=Tanacetum cinerariifolium TaxID=118510 RepID=A0A6L2L784_TANCI|nr:reverse transcriptase [Tanacetum cinerariifolium]
MEDFSIYGSSFDHCLKNLDKMLKRYEETNLVLNWEKCHFMVKEGIVLSHKISADHLSRLENPNLGKLTKAEIKDLFPEERLMTDSDKNNEPWLYLTRKSLEVLRKFYWTTLGGRSNQLLHVSSPLLSKPVEY